MLSLPTLAAIDDVGVLAGAPLHIPLNGFDADNDALKFSVSSTNPSLTTSIPEGNRSMRISVQNHGDMVLELFEQRAPRTTARIAELVDAGFYNGVTFHRIIEDFMIQGGDPGGDGTGGSGVQIEDEYHPELLLTSKGILAMANSGPNTNDSQFFITAAPARHLDNKHPVFGFLTSGEEVRQSIAGVSTGANDRPNNPVVMTSVEIFMDVQNGVLMLSAPKGTNGQADVTVTVDDGHGGTDQQTFHVTIADPPDEWTAIDPIVTSADTAASLTLPPLDIQGVDVVYEGFDWSDDLDVQVGASDGYTTVTPKNGLAGVQWTYMSAEVLDGYASYYQYVPVYIDPAAPSGVELLASTDTGSSDDDGITRRNNSPGNLLSFRVSGVLDGAEVTVLAGGVEIAQATATGNSAVVQTDGSFVLSDGVHSITARQVLRDQPVNVGDWNDTVSLTSPSSTATSIRVDTSLPQFLSAPVEVASEGVQYVYDMETNEEADGGVTYRLLTSPAGMLVNHDTGKITWTPQPGQGPTEPVVVLASDTAGNETRQEFEVRINEAPEIEPIADQPVAEGSLLTFTVKATDPDLPVVFSLAGDVPAGATIDPNTGVFRWTPSEAQGPGDYRITVRATDARGATSGEAVEIHVSEVNVPPVLAPIDDQTVDEDQLLDFTVEVTDPDVPVHLTFSLGGEVPKGASIDASSGRFTFRPNELQGGQNFQVVVRVTDGLSPPVEQPFTIHVNEVDRPPVVGSVDAQFVRPGGELKMVVPASDPDVPSNAIRYSLEPGAPEGVQIDPDSGLLTWSVPEDMDELVVELSVRVTEITGEGPGLSSVALIKVLLFEFPDLFIDVAASPRANQAAVAPGPELPAAMFEALAAQAGTASPPSSAPVSQPSSGAFQQDMFGTRIGLRDSSGGPAEPIEKDGQDQEQPSDESPPENPEDVKQIDYQQDNRDEATQSGRRVPKANDAAIQRFVSDEELAAWLAE